MEGTPTATSVGSVASDSEEADWSSGHKEAWRGPEVWPRDPEAASVVAGAPACLCPSCLDAALGVFLAFSVAVGWGFVAPLADPVLQTKDGWHHKELTSSSSASLGPQRVEWGSVTVGDDGGRKDRSAATLGKTSQRFPGARAHVCWEAPPFQRSATALASLDTSRPNLCKSLSAGLASPAVRWTRGVAVRSLLQNPDSS